VGSLRKMEEKCRERRRRRRTAMGVSKRKLKWCQMLG